MFSKTVVNSAKFLMMPVSSRELYFELGINADDDGIVEAFNVLRLVSASEDDLKVLATKGFVKILNEDLVTYITDWKANNRIRADRKVDSIYKNLLLKIIPEIEVMSPKPRADTGKPTGRPMDNQRTAQVRLGKVRLGKDSIEKQQLEQPLPPLSKYDKYFSVISQFCEKNFGFVAPIWQESLQYDFEDWIKLNQDPKQVTNIICLALKEAAGANKVSNKVKYAESILDRWEKNKLTTVDEIKADQKEHQQRQEQRQSGYRQHQPVQKEKVPDWSEATNQQQQYTPDEQKALQAKLAALSKRKEVET
jgi:DnaD/phage-associated family protein